MVYDFLPMESTRTFHLEILKDVCSMIISQLMRTPNYNFFSYEVYAASIAEVSFNFKHHIIKKMGCIQMEWVYWQEQQSRNFPASVGLWCLIWMAPNLQWKCLPLRGGHIPNFLQSFLRYEQSNFQKKSSFWILCKNRYNSHTRASIWLKFGTGIRSLKANTSIKFGVNLINIKGAISDFIHKAKSNFLSSLQGKLLWGTIWKSVCS